MNRNRQNLQSKLPALPATRGPIATAKEWIWCLFSTKHAEQTWLRIEADTERRTLRRLERVAFTIIGALIAMVFFTMYQYAFYKDMTIYEFHDSTIYVKPKN